MQVCPRGTTRRRKIDMGEVKTQEEDNMTRNRDRQWTAEIRTKLVLLRLRLDLVFLDHVLKHVQLHLSRTVLKL